MCVPSRASDGPYGRLFATMAMNRESPNAQLLRLQGWDLKLTVSNQKKMWEMKPQRHRTYVHKDIVQKRPSKLKQTKRLP